MSFVKINGQYVRADLIKSVRFEGGQVRYERTDTILVGGDRITDPDEVAALCSRFNLPNPGAAAPGQRAEQFRVTGVTEVDPFGGREVLLSSGPKWIEGVEEEGLRLRLRGLGGNRNVTPQIGDECRLTVRFTRPAPPSPSSAATPDPRPESRPAVET